MTDFEMAIRNLTNACVQMHGCGRYTPEDVDELEKCAWSVVKQYRDLHTWISVKDRLPCEYGNYLAVVNGEVMECLYSVWPNAIINSAWSTCDADGFKWVPETEITHWMPLPEPQKEGEENG